MGSLSGATTGNQRYLRAGIDHYDSTSAYETTGIIYTNVSLASG